MSNCDKRPHGGVKAIVIKTCPDGKVIKTSDYVDERERGIVGRY